MEAKNNLTLKERMDFVDGVVDLAKTGADGCGQLN